MSICAFPAHDLHVTVSRTRVTLALAPGRALEGNNTVGNWKTVTVPAHVGQALSEAAVQAACQADNVSEA